MARPGFFMVVKVMTRPYRSCIYYSDGVMLSYSKGGSPMRVYQYLTLALLAFTVLTILACSYCRECTAHKNNPQNTAKAQIMVPPNKIIIPQNTNPNPAIIPRHQHSGPIVIPKGPFPSKIIPSPFPPDDSLKPIYPEYEPQIDPHNLPKCWVPYEFNGLTYYWIPLSEQANAAR